MSKKADAPAARADTMGGARTSKPEPAVLDAYERAWADVVSGLGDVAMRGDVLVVPAVQAFVWQLQRITQTIAAESSDGATVDEYTQRLAAGFPRATHREKRAETPLGRAEQSTVEEWVRGEHGYTTKIAFAEGIVERLRKDFGVKVDPQKTIVDRWLVGR